MFPVAEPHPLLYLRQSLRDAKRYPFMNHRFALKRQFPDRRGVSPVAMEAAPSRAGANGADVAAALGTPIDVDGLRTGLPQAVRLLKAMGNERRLLVLCHLVPGEKSVGELESLLGISQSALSQHLARLRHDGLVQTRRDAQTIYYSLAGSEAKAIMATLYGLYCRQ